MSSVCFSLWENEPAISFNGGFLKMKKLILLFTLFNIFFSAITSGATTYYMATTGSDSNGGTANSPWATLNYAQSQLSPGDTLLIKGGVYHDQRVDQKFVSGTASARITISGAPGEQAIFDGDNKTKGLLCELRNSSYVTFKDLEI